MEEFENLLAFSKYMGAADPLHPDIGIAKIEESYRNFRHVDMSAFRHRFFAVTLYIGEDIDLNVGFWKRKISGPFLVFKTPYQVMSWNAATMPDAIRGYYVIFTENFVLSYPQIGLIISEFPFLKLDKALPFTISADEVSDLLETYKKIEQEYYSSNADRIEMICTYLQTLLYQVRRLYEQSILTDRLLLTTTNASDNELVLRYKKMIDQYVCVLKDNEDTHAVNYYANYLAVHPYYLNATVKRYTGKTALELIKERIIYHAKTLLLQTSLSIKEIAFQLAFKEAAHFSNFFKKHTAMNPKQYREQSKI